MADPSPHLPGPLSRPRPEAMADVPGVCELSLTRAVVQYRNVHEVDLTDGRIEDVGMALVLDGQYASAAQAVDLGSGRVKQLDLSTELVVLDWIYEPTLEHVHGLLRAAADPSTQGKTARADLETYCFDLALRVLRRAGFGPLSRPILLRIGFRDICRDLDFHEGTSVRLVLGRGRVIRAQMDVDGNALVFRTAFEQADDALEEALARAFPGRDIRRLMPPSETQGLAYQVRFPLSLTFLETRMLIREIREGLSQLVARFEPDRYDNLRELLETFGTRETLSRLYVREEKDVSQRLTTPPQTGSTAVH